MTAEYARAALRGEVDRVTAAQEGSRNDTLNVAAFRLGQLVANDELPITEVEDELVAAGVAAGLGAAEARATVRSGLRSGAARPREGNPSTVAFPGMNGRTTRASFEERLNRLPPLAGGAPQPVDIPARVASNGNGAAAAAEPSWVERVRAAGVDATRLDELMEPEPLVGKILFRDAIAWLYGPPGSGKSFLALDLAGCVGTGESWQGIGRTAPGAVLYVAAEGVTGLRKRVRAWQTAMGRAMDGVKILPMAVQATNPEAWMALIEYAVELKACLVVLDTQARVTVGLEENSATEMGRFVQAVERLRAATGACVLVVHHSGRAGSEHMRGSIALDGAATTIIKVTRTEEIIDIECPKQKDGAEFEPIRLRMVPVEGSIVVAISEGRVSRSNSAASARWVSEWWQCFETDWTSVAAITDATSVTRATLFRHVKPLERQGLVEVQGSGRIKQYRLTRPPSVSMSLTQSHSLSETRGPAGGVSVSESHPPLGVRL